MKKQIFILLAIAVLLPSAVAFNCNSLSGGDFHVCNSIQETNLSHADKDLLISDIFNKNKTSPNFDFIYSWNTNLKIKNSPDSRVYSSGTINNAWIKIIALMPSIIVNDTLYSTNNGKLLTAYNSQATLPSGTEYGDCRTNYYSLTKRDTLNIYLNNNLIGNNKLSSFYINSNPDNLNFIARLNIQTNYYVDHYKRKRHCDDWDDDGNCISHYYSCDFYYTEYRTDTLQLSDTLNSKLYKNQLGSSFKITDKYYNITKGILEAENFTNLILSFNNSIYQNTQYIYSLNYTPPYYVLTLRADKVEYTNFNNIHVDKINNQFYFNVKDTSNCKIELSDFFSSVDKSCDLTFNQTNFSISTDKTNYYENDTIKVYVSPSNINVKLTYNNQPKLVRNYTEFKAVLYENKISSELNDNKVELLVNVNKREDFEMIYNLGVLSFFGFFFYRAAKVYYLNFNF